jgi:peptidoglycan hydrolase-like protein with peptidoglycan-binding domain
VRVVEVPDTLIEINPEWRGHRYFVVSDDIVIVDSGHRIVATVPIGSSGAQLDTSRSAQLGTDDGMDLSGDEIRQVQIVLKQKNFFDGEPDGVFDARTREALILFQQRQGLQASGRIDVRTTAALGVSVRGGQQGNQGANSQPSTTGQGGAQQQPSTQGQPRANEDMGANRAGQSGDHSSTTGQGGDKIQQPRANQEGGDAQQGDQGQPATTGRGGNATQSPAPNMNQNNRNQSNGAAPRSGGQAK